MSFVTAAQEFERERKVVEAAWAYEVAIQLEQLDHESMIDLAVLYFVSNDTGFFSAYNLDSKFVDAAYQRALDVLSAADLRFGSSSESEFWRIHMRERVLGDIIPLEMYERLAVAGAESAYIALYAATNHEQFRNEAHRIFEACEAAATAKQRYLLSFR